MIRMGWLSALAFLTVVGSLGAAEGPGALPERPAGSGVIVHPDGYVLTAHHVLAHARRVVVVTQGEFRAPAVVVSADPDQDLALLKIETVGLSEAPVGYANAVTLDQEVAVLGFSFGLREVSVVRGRIAAIRSKGVKRVFQVDAAVNPGNSGGPVFNKRGEVIGIVTTKFTHPSGIAPEGMAFAVPISYATPLLANIPDFDFTRIGKGRGTARADAEDTIRDMARTTVRIEIARAPEPSAAQPGAEARPPKVEARPNPARRPSPKVGPELEPGGGDHAADVVKVNEQLLEAQQQELRRFAEQGIQPPEGMVLIPAGEFLMGAEDGLPDARPAHTVSLSSYWIDKYEVTNAQYRRCVEAGVCAPPKDRAAYDDPRQASHPVTNVTWLQAREYCHWRGARLPTEAEWEKAARGTDGRRYPWGNSEQAIPRPARNGDARLNSHGIEPVGSHAGTLSPYGVQDLAGNVWEWVKDWYAEDYYAVSPSRDPQGPLRGSFRVMRGGDWTRSSLELRVTYRAWDEMTYWGPTLGFRCADDAP